MKVRPIGFNQTEVLTNGLKVLFSYQTPVAFEDMNGLVYVTDKKWSITTSRHINNWLKNRPHKKVSQDSIFGALED